MAILVTGGTGYIGSHTVVDLLNNNYEVVIVDNFVNSKPEVLNRIFKITNKKPKFYQLDVRDEENMRNVFADNKIDAIIHFAGLKSVAESVAKPDLYIDNNIGSSKVLLKLMKEFNVNNLVFSSSATVYGVPKHVPLKEDDEVGGCTNPYGQTKLDIEYLLKDYAKENKSANIAILRYFNPIGAHPSGLIGEDPNGIPNNLMPYITQVAIGKRDHLNVYGNDYKTIDGTGVRDYIHVVDLARGHLCALEKLDSKPGLVIYNLGTGKGTSVLELVNAFEKANKIKIKYEICDRRPGDVDTNYADATKAYDEMNFKTELDIVDACKDSWRWQKNNPNGYDSNRQEFELEVVDGHILKGYKWEIDSPKAYVVIMEGMEEHLTRYDAFAKFLNSNGYAAIGLDTYGQGLNVKDDLSNIGDWPEDGFNKQIIANNILIKKLQEEKHKVYIFSHSMGSFMAQGYMQMFPGSVDKIVLCGTGSKNPLLPVGLTLAKAIMRNKKKQNAKAVVLNNLMFGSFNKKIKNKRTTFDWLSYNEENVDNYIKDPLCGFGSRNRFCFEFIKGMISVYTPKGLNSINKDQQILIITGQDDPVSHYGKDVQELLKMYNDLGIKNVSSKIFKNMRHEILNEKNNEAVLETVKEFLEK